MKCLNCGRIVTGDKVFDQATFNTLVNSRSATFNNVEYKIDDKNNILFECPYCKVKNEMSANQFVDNINKDIEEEKKKKEAEEQENNRHSGGGGDIGISDPTLISIAKLKLSNYMQCLQPLHSSINTFAGLMDGLQINSSGEAANILSDLGSLLQSDSPIGLLYKQLSDTETAIKNVHPNYDLYVAMGYLQLLGEDDNNSNFYGVELTERERANIFYNLEETLKNNKGNYSLVADGTELKEGEISLNTYEQLLSACGSLAASFMLSGLGDGLTSGNQAGSISGGAGGGGNPDSSVTVNNQDSEDSEEAKKVFSSLSEVTNGLNGTSEYEKIFATDSMYSDFVPLLTDLTQEDYFDNVDKFQIIEDDYIEQYQEAVNEYKSYTNELIIEWEKIGHTTTFTRSQYLEDQLINNEEYKKLSENVVALSETISVVHQLKNWNFEKAFAAYKDRSDYSDKIVNPIAGYETREVLKPMVIEDGDKDIIIHSYEEYAAYLDKCIEENPEMYDEVWKAERLNANSDYFNSTSLQIVFYDKDGNAVDDNYTKAMYINENDLDLESIFGNSLYDSNGSQFNEIMDIKYKCDENVWAYLNDDEKNILKYLFNTDETDRLDSYIKYTTDLSFQRNGMEMAQEVIDGINGIYGGIGTNLGIDELTGEYIEYSELDAFTDTCIYLSKTGFKDGLNMFADGIDNLFHSDGITSANEYKTQYILSYLNEKYKNSGKLANWISTGSYEIFDSIGNMAPSMLISMIPGAQMLGLSLMGASAAGNAKEKGLQMGMDEGAAWLYGILDGISEAGLQYLIGGLPGLSNMEKFAKVGGIKGFLAKMASEGFEESTQAILEPLFATMATGGKIAYEVNWGEVLKSGIYGMITAGIMNGGQIVVGGTIYTITEDMIPELVEKFKGHDLTSVDELNNLRTALEERSNNALTWEDEIASINANINPEEYGIKLKRAILEETESIVNNISDDEITSLAHELNISETTAKQYLIARQLYLSLNNRVSYDSVYIKSRNADEILADGEITESEYQKLLAYKARVEDTYRNKTTFENMSNSAVVCHEWASLYHELLVDAGIPENIIRYRGFRAHTWIEIKLDDNVIVADAADARSEFSNVRRGKTTQGFLFGPATNYEGERITSLYDSLNGEAKDNFFKARGGEDITPVDNLLGYGNNYLNNVIENTSNTELEPKDIFNQFVQQTSIPSNMDGLELYNYFATIAGNMHYYSDEIRLNSYINDSGKVEYVFEYNCEDFSYKYSLENGVYDYVKK